MDRPSTGSCCFPGAHGHPVTHHNHTIDLVVFAFLLVCYSAHWTTTDVLSSSSPPRPAARQYAVSPRFSLHPLVTPTLTANGAKVQPGSWPASWRDICLEVIRRHRILKSPSGSYTGTVLDSHRRPSCQDAKIVRITPESQTPAQRGEGLLSFWSSIRRSYSPCTNHSVQLI